MTTSVFSSGAYQSHETQRGLLSNLAAGATSIRLGDTTKGGGSSARVSTVQAWDLGVPDVGSTAISKRAVLDSLQYEIVPTATRSGGNAGNQVMAILAADGHWDRSTQNALHADQGAPQYSAASFSSSPDFVGLNSSGVEVFDTQSDATGAMDFSTGGQDPWGTFGVTAKLPAGQNLKTIRIRIKRNDAPLVPAPDMIVNVYTLTGNARNYTLDQLIGTTVARSYGDLALTYSDIDWTLTTSIVASDADRWFGFMIEGPWFDPTYFSTQTITIPVRQTALPTAYLAGTDGSLLHASKEAGAQWPNSFPGFYFYRPDLPFVYPASSTTELTTPYQRFFGTTMAKTVGGWTLGVPRTLGSVGSGADDEFSGLLANAQAWIDAADFDPDNGNSWFGMILEAFNPDDNFRSYGGPGHATFQPISLTIVWHVDPVAVRADSRSRPRVSAGASNARDRVRSDAEARSRVFAASQASNRVEVTRARAVGRVRAPLSTARSQV